MYLKRLRKASFTQFLILSCTIAPLAMAQDEVPEAFAAEVITVHSGTRYQVDTGSAIRTVFLFGATAANVSTPEGTRAKAQAEVLAAGRSVQVIVRESRGSISYADVLLPGGKNLAHELVRNGWARWDRARAANDTALKALEELAKSDGAGMWAGSPDYSLPETADTAAPRAPQETIEIGTPTSSQRNRRGNANRDAFGTLHLQSKGRISTTRMMERKNELRARQAAEAEARRIAEEERRLAYEAEMEAQRQAQAEANREAIALEKERLELEREQLRNQALYNQVNQNRQQVYMVNNGGYYYTNQTYGQQITITPRQQVINKEGESSPE